MASCFTHYFNWGCNMESDIMKHLIVENLKYCYPLAKDLALKGVSFEVDKGNS